MERWTFGEAPLDETVELASVLRDLMGTALALEQPSDELRALVADLRARQTRLAAQLPPDLRPRVGDDPSPDRRVYLDHSRDVGDYNACFPRYELTVADDRAVGRVEFPIVYEGPPGVVHGGFLAVFFDCAFQQLNCDMGVAGKTRSLALRYRRPVPILAELEIEAHRTVADGSIESSGELRLDGTVMCRAEMSAVLGDRAALPAVSPRRRP
ncbi:MAG TPA: PaaI family thioesterase [Acidimicrobiia bacterium]|nr:PaaI family thioesterase [Acidimicrobiia bacterium]